MEMVLNKTDIVEAISVTSDEAKTLNSQSQGTNTWGVTVTHVGATNDGLYQGVVNVDGGNVRKDTSIDLISFDGKQWWSSSYYYRSLKVEKEDGNDMSD